MICIFFTGHVIYEMATGRELEEVFPGKKNYNKVPKQLLPLLKFIFEEEPGFDEVMKCIVFATREDITFFSI